MSIALRVFLTGFLVSLVSACGSTQKATSPVEVNENFKSIPAWVLKPTPEQGLGAASCVAYSGNLSVDQKLAISNARVALAQQVKSKVASMEKNYSQRQELNSSKETGISFEAVSKTITSETLAGSRAEQFGIATINGVDHYCAHVVMNEQDSHSALNNALSAANSNLSQSEQDFLYQEFKAHKAEQSLEKVMADLNIN